MSLVAEILGFCRCLKMGKYVPFLNLWTLWIILSLSKYGLTTFVISGFDSGQRMIFPNQSSISSQSSSSQTNYTIPYFNYLNFDSKNTSRMYIGGVDFLYRLNADNIALGSTKSDNLTAVPQFANLLSSSLSTCQGVFQQSNPSYLCRNHIRAAFQMGSEMYICGTGASSPQEFYLNYETLKFVTLTEDSSFLVTNCPNDPDSHYTVLYVDSGQGLPNGLPAIYSSINSLYSNKLYRSNLRYNRSTPVELYMLNMQLQDVTFIASYEIDQYVYYFFGEVAAEASQCGTVRYPRVARVCKNDRGSQTYKTQFITFVRARLNCSVSAGNNIPVYFNELYDVQYDAANQVFYGLFMANQNSSWGSAVCKFSLESINNKFNNGQFYSQESTDSQWTVTPDNIVPKPRTSMCLENNTLNLNIFSQSFAITHNLMYGTIDQLTSMPLYYNQEIGFSHLALDFVQGSENSFTVLCLYSDIRPDEIVRVVQWTENGTVNGAVSSRIFSVLRPFGKNSEKLRQMQLRKSSGKSWLYVVKDSEVFQISMDLCSQYKLCTDCVVDPYCGWDAEKKQCRLYGNGVIQNVTSLSPLAACNDACKVSVSSSQYCIPGMALHMDCVSNCAPESDVVWKFPNGSIVQTWPDNPNFVLTQNGGLVIVNLTRGLSGTFKCTSKNFVLAEHTIKTSRCAYSEDVGSIIATEYGNWCQAFAEYQAQYNDWYCSRQNCSSPICKENSFCKNR